MKQISQRINEKYSYHWFLSVKRKNNVKRFISWDEDNLLQFTITDCVWNKNVPIYAKTYA